MLYRSLFPRDLFADLERLQREVHGVFDASPSIRGIGRGGYPALNVGTTPESVEVYAFAPGMDPASIEVHLERGVLTLSGERAATAPSSAPNSVTSSTDKGDTRTGSQATLHINERFAGPFRRVVSLPDDIDPNAVNASYRDGVLRVSVPRRAASQPRRIEVQ